MIDNELHEDHSALHERYKLAAKLAQRASDGLEAASFAYADDPSDWSRDRVNKAIRLLDEATEELDEFRRLMSLHDDPLC